MTVQLNEQRQKVFLDRYAKKNDRGEPVEKTLDSMWARVALAIGDSAEEHDAFEKILRDFKFVPGGRILAGAGVGTEQTFYNCYVIPVEPKPSTVAYAQNPVGNDSRESIFDTIATMVDIMSRGGGVGINWSTLRPSGSYLSRVSGTSSGPVGWMDVASKAVGEVEQGGSRRGAAMFMLDDWHPDILNFIEAKRDYSKITNANVSIAISDRFMEAVRNDAGWNLEFPNTSEPDYNTVWDGDLEKWRASGRGLSIYRSMPARRIWDALVAAAHASGEPGLVFLGRYNQQSTGRDVERIISVNPCGEQGLGAYSVCNLGSMNLAAYVTTDGPTVGFNYPAFARDTRTAVRFLDNVIDKSFYWDDRSKQRQQDLRRIGLGVMGLADVLIMLHIRYGSPEAVDFTEGVFQLMKDEAIKASVELAEEKGPAGAYDEKMWNRPYLREYVNRHHPQGFPSVYPGPLRNLFFLTQAPTGTTSILAGVNSGIEPYFAFSYTRKDRTGEHRVLADIVKPFEGGPPQEFLVTSNDISVEEHIAMQAAVQKYVDSSVSKTINGPNSHTVKDVDKAYRMAYDAGLKGLAYFRDGSGRDQVLYKDEPKGLAGSVVQRPLEADEKILHENEELKEQIALLEETVALGPKAESYRRPERVSGVTSRLNTSMGTMYLTVNRDDETGQPVEIFVNVGKAGSDVMALGEAIGRLVSTGLQWGIPLNKVADQLVGVGGTSSLSPGLVHAIGKALANSSGAGSAIAKAAYPAPSATEVLKIVEEEFYDDILSTSVCPDCQNISLVREEGCEKCNLCGFSRC